jgi:flagellar export protein FliJ
MTKFRLSRIIEVKEKLIEDKERELEGAISILNDVIASIQSIEKDTENSYGTLTIPSLSGGDFSVIKDYLSYLENRRACLLDEKASTESKIDHLRVDLVELMKEMKMLETLQSKTFKAMKKSANRKEQKNLDAMALRLSEGNQFR